MQANRHMFGDFQDELILVKSAFRKSLKTMVAVRPVKQRKASDYANRFWHTLPEIEMLEF